MKTNRSRFLLAVAVTCLALVAAVLGAGGLLIGNVLASSPWSGTTASVAGPWSGHWGGAPWAGEHAGWQLPPQLSELADVPAEQRFSHFRSAQVQLTDKDNNPLVVQVIPGTATVVTQTGLTLTANDGSSRTFAVDNNTAIHGATSRQAGSGTSAVKKDDHVIVVTLNSSATATAVLIPGASGFWPGGPVGH